MSDCTSEWFLPAGVLVSQDGYTQQNYLRMIRMMKQQFILILVLLCYKIFDISPTSFSVLLA